LDELDGYSKRWLRIIPYRTSRIQFRKCKAFQERRANFGEANEPGHGKISGAVPQSRCEGNGRRMVSDVAGNREKVPGAVLAAYNTVANFFSDENRTPVQWHRRRIDREISVRQGASPMVLDFT